MGQKFYINFIAELRFLHNYRDLTFTYCKYNLAGVLDIGTDLFTYYLWEFYIDPLQKGGSRALHSL